MRLVRLVESFNEDKYGRYANLEKDRSFVSDFQKMIGYYSKKSNPKQLVSAVRRNPVKFWNRFAISLILSDLNDEAADICQAFEDEADSWDRKRSLEDELDLDYKEVEKFLDEFVDHYKDNKSLIPSKFRDQIDEISDKGKRLNSTGEGISWWPKNLWRRYLVQLDDRYPGIKLDNKSVNVPSRYLDWDSRNGLVWTLGNKLTFTYDGESISIRVYTHTSETGEGCYGYTIEDNWSVYEEPSFKKFLNGLDGMIVKAFG